jgi:recombinational DNA repair protein RecR
MSNPPTIDLDQQIEDVRKELDRLLLLKQAEQVKQTHAAGGEAESDIKTCQAVNKSGKNKGQTCKNKARDGSCYCGTHIRSEAAKKAKPPASQT